MICYQIIRLGFSFYLPEFWIRRLQGFSVRVDLVYLVTIGCYGLLSVLQLLSLEMHYFHPRNSRFVIQFNLIRMEILLCDLENSYSVINQKDQNYYTQPAAKLYQLVLVPVSNFIFCLLF